MFRSRGTRSAAIAAILSGLSGCGGGGGDPAPNLVLISIDSLRADHLGCYGYGPPTSPVIDRLAAEGVRFSEAISTTSWTLPAHAAMLTGLHDSAHGVTDRSRRLADGHRTLAETLRDAGYRTAGFYGGPFLHPVFGLDQGFEVWESCMADIPDSASRGDIESALGADEAVMHVDVTGPRTLEAVEAWTERDDPRPFFLFVHLWDVHYDYLAPDEYVGLFADPDYDGPIDGRDFETSDLIHPRMDERDLQHLIALYDAEIRFTDDVVGGILGALERRGLLANTVLVLTSDHGDEFFEHGRKGHQETLFDEVVHVPLIFHASGRFAPRVVEQQVSLVSIAPTLLALAGVAHGPASSGADLSPLLEGGRLPPLPAFSELLVQEPLYSLRSEDLKVVYEPGASRPVRAYDLANDPREKRKLDPDADPRIAEAVRHIELLIDAAAEASTHEGLDPSLEKRLRELGYLGDGE